MGISWLKPCRINTFYFNAQDPHKGEFFRIAHLGYMGAFDITTALTALEMTLLDLGYNQFQPGASVAAAEKILREMGMTTRILIADHLDQEAIEELQAVPGFEVTVKTGLNEADLVELFDFEVVVVRSATKITRPIIEAGQNLKLIVRAESV